MSGRILHIDPAAHKVVDALLPWFVNETLECEERVFVEQHLDQCERCRREVDWLRELHAACAAAAAVPGSAPAVRHLQRGLKAPRATPGIAGRLRAHWQRAQPWSRAVIAAQLAAILVLGAVILGSDESQAPYRTLAAPGSAAPATASLVVVFDPAATERDLRRVLHAAGARIVDGPTQSNAYLLDVSPPGREQAMRALRAERSVVLVEALDAGGAR